MEFVGSPAKYTSTPVPLPNFDLDRSWNHTATLRPQRRHTSEVFIAFHRYKAKFDNCTNAVRLLPSIYQVENAVVRPDPLLKLLVDADAFG